MNHFGQFFFAISVLFSSDHATLGPPNEILTHTFEILRKFWASITESKHFYYYDMLRFPVAFLQFLWFVFCDCWACYGVVFVFEKQKRNKVFLNVRQNERHSKINPA